MTTLRTSEPCPICLRFDCRAAGGAVALCPHGPPEGVEPEYVTAASEPGSFGAAIAAMLAEPRPREVLREGAQHTPLQPGEIREYVIILDDDFASTDAPKQRSNCDTCRHDRGRVCGVIAAHNDDASDLQCAVVSWVRRHCDDETLRPVNDATCCPGWEAR